MMFLKGDVRLKGIQPEMCVCLMVAHDVYEVAGQGHRFMVTSVTDGKHMEKSLHYRGLAVDLRLPEAQMVSKVVYDLTRALGNEFDVVCEKDHIHVEYDPE